MVLQDAIGAAAAGALLLGGLVGCSQDKHVFESTIFLPTTVKIETPVTHEVLWSKDIPVQHKLVLDFDSPQQVESKTLGVSFPFEFEPAKVNMQPATKMSWKIFPTRKALRNAIEEGELALPGMPIMMKVSYRPSPEYPQQAPAPELDIEPVQEPEAADETADEVEMPADPMEMAEPAEVEAEAEDEAPEVRSEAVVPEMMDILAPPAEFLNGEHEGAAGDDEATDGAADEAAEMSDALDSDAEAADEAAAALPEAEK